MSPLFNSAGYRLKKTAGPCRFNRRIFRPRSLVQLATLAVILYICYILGLFTHMLERDLAEFRYPLKIDINIAIKTLKKDETSSKYLDVNKFNFTFIHRADGVCKPSSDRTRPDRPYLVVLVKSKYSHYENRQAIRQTWGKSDSERLIRTVFLIGVPSSAELGLSEEELETNNENEHHQHHNMANESQNEELSHFDDEAIRRRLKKYSYYENDQYELNQKRERIYKRIEHENNKYGDIVQQNFEDTYYNNTLKTLMGLRWVNDYCTTSTFYLFIDDDYYLNPNLLVEFLQANITGSTRNHRPSQSTSMSTLYAGYVFSNSAPMRHSFSKWYISLKEYPYNRYPPYVSAGCYIMSLESVRLFYMASKLIEAFKLDDIYMGILAHKLDVKPLHIENIYFYPPKYDPIFYAHSVIASHQFEKEALKSVWNELEPAIKFDGLRNARRKLKNLTPSL